VSYLVLVRHGRSQWNDENRFTGWVDVPLAEPGRAEAVRAGEQLRELGFTFDRAYTSTLQRAITTGRLILDVLGQTDLEQIQAWELNERFYGALTGRNKDETREKFGEEQVHIWRRSYATAPPGGESLKDTAERALPYFETHIRPATTEVDAVLVSAHGNSLRAIVKELDGLDDDQVTQLEIATGVPIVYEMRYGQVKDKRVLDD
jgi:2,3-bisphosphoglycerate-dependent phosphoglycerate mutase